MPHPLPQKVIFHSLLITFTSGISPIDAIMYGAENRTIVPIEVTFSLAQSQNVAFSTTSPIVKKVIQPNRVEFLMHVRKEHLGKDTHLDYDFRYKDAKE